MNAKSKFEIVIEKAEHYNALGIEEIYLSTADKKPWHLITELKVYQSTGPLSLEFVAKSQTNLKFRWNDSLHQFDSDMIDM